MLPIKLGNPILPEISHGKRRRVGGERYREPPIPSERGPGLDPCRALSGGKLAQNQNAGAPSDKSVSAEDMPAKCLAGQYPQQPSDGVAAGWIGAVAKGEHQRRQCCFREISGCREQRLWIKHSESRRVQSDRPRQQLIAALLVIGPLTARRAEPMKLRVAVEIRRCREAERARRRN